MNLFLLLIFNLALTIVIELLVMCLLSKEANALKMSIACNLVTNPLANVILILLANLTNINVWCYYICVFIIEVLVIICEAYLYIKKLDWKPSKGFKVSLCCNAASYIVGLILQLLIR